MKELPILFSTPMVQAILAGRKTQTRRVVKGLADEWLTQFTPEYVADPGSFFSPYGYAGDLLWVRETFINDGDNEKPVYVHKAGNENYPRTSGCSWKPSIHMPKAAARIWLQVESIRIERLNDISEDDAVAEGIEYGDKTLYGGELRTFYKNYKSKDGATFYSAQMSYQSLWDSINAKPTVDGGPSTVAWQSNPWVWVITFKVLSTTGKPHNLFEALMDADLGIQ